MDSVLRERHQCNREIAENSGHENYYWKDWKLQKCHKFFGKCEFKQIFA